MSNKKLKYIVTGVCSIIIIAGLFIAADYFSLFGSRIEKRLSFAEIRFRTLDKENGNIVMNAGVRCFQKTNINSCTLKDSHQVGVVSVNVPIQKAVKKTLLFKKAEEIYKSLDPEINIMIIHNDYYKQTIEMKMEELYSNSIIEKTIEMSPIDRGESDTEEEEL